MYVCRFFPNDFSTVKRKINLRAYAYRRAYEIYVELRLRRRVLNKHAEFFIINYVESLSSIPAYLE